MRKLHVSMSIVVAMATFILAGQAALAAPSSSPAPKDPPSRSRPVTTTEKAAVQALIRDLYQAYVSRDLQRIMDMEKMAIEASAQDYERRGKGKADDVRNAFRDCTQDVLQAKGFQMKPLHLEDLEYRSQGDDVVVSSVIPIIATERVEVGEPGGGNMVRMTISSFVFRKKGNAYEIVRMDLQ